MTTLLKGAPGFRSFGGTGGSSLTKLMRPASERNSGLALKLNGASRGPIVGLSHLSSPRGVQGPRDITRLGPITRLVPKLEKQSPNAVLF